MWDQLLATKAEIIQSKLYFRFACIMPELSLQRLTRGHNKGFLITFFAEREWTSQLRDSK